jgi:hypothetical protein
LSIITLTKHAQYKYHSTTTEPDSVVGAPGFDVEITPAMIEAGVNELLRRGIGNDGETMGFLREAMEAVFSAMESVRQGK